MKEMVNITIEFIVDLDPEEDVWVDGDCPEDVTLEKVIAKIQEEKYRDVSEWLIDWELLQEPEVTINVGDDSVRITNAMVSRDV